MITPSGASRRAIPATKSLRSGTWASTLFADDEIGRDRRARIAVGRLDVRRTAPRSGIPAVRRPRATFAAGSMPRTGSPRATNMLQQVPVVARDLDDAGSEPERETLDRRRRRTARRARPNCPSTRRSRRSRAKMFSGGTTSSTCTRSTASQIAGVQRVGPARVRCSRVRYAFAAAGAQVDHRVVEGGAARRHCGGVLTGRPELGSD